MDRRKIAVRLMMLRGERSKAEVAAALGVSRSALGMYESGARVPRDAIKQAFARYYGVSVDELFYGENDEAAG